MLKLMHACLDSPKDFSEFVFVVCSQFLPINFDVTAVTSGKGSRERLDECSEASDLF